jgi:ribosomal protein L13E
LSQTVKYNSKKRAGRGFTFEELKVGAAAAAYSCFPFELPFA